MEDAPIQPSSADKIVITLLHVFAVSSTLYRLGHRLKIRRLWWDDYASIVPFAFNIYYLCSLWSKPLQLRMNSPAESMHQLYDGYWLAILPFLVILWVSRAILASTLARVFWRRHAARRVAFCVVVAMMVLFVVSVVVNFTTCQRGAKQLPSTPERVVNCSTGDGLENGRKLLMLAIDMLGNCILVAAPLYFLLRVRLKDSDERRLIQALLCGSLLGSVVSVLFIVMAQTGLLQRYYPSVMLHVEAAAAICISNLSIVSTCLYSSILGRHRPTRSRRTRSHSSRSHTHTHSHSNSNSHSHSHSASSASESNCLCYTRSSATPTEESSKVTMITLTEYSVFGSLRPSEIPSATSTASMFSSDSSRNLVHWSASDDKHSTAGTDNVDLSENAPTSRTASDPSVSSHQARGASNHAP